MLHSAVHPLASPAVGLQRTSLGLPRHRTPVPASIPGACDTFSRRELYNGLVPGMSPVLSMNSREKGVTSRGPQTYQCLRYPMYSTVLAKYIQTPFVA